MNKESSVKQLKRIKQDMTHADDVNALDFAIRFMGNKTLDKIRAEIKQLPYQRIFGNVSSYSLLDTVVEIIDKYKAESEADT